MEALLLRILNNFAEQGVMGGIIVILGWYIHTLHQQIKAITADRLDEGKAVATTLTNTNHAQIKVAEALDHAADGSNDVADGMRDIAEAVRLLQAGVGALQNAIDRSLR